jgi:hypothetical protein
VFVMWLCGKSLPPSLLNLHCRKDLLLRVYSPHDQSRTSYYCCDETLIPGGEEEFIYTTAATRDDYYKHDESNENNNNTSLSLDDDDDDHVGTIDDHECQLESSNSEFTVESNRMMDLMMDTPFDERLMEEDEEDEEEEDVVVSSRPSVSTTYIPLQPPPPPLPSNNNNDNNKRNDNDDRNTKTMTIVINDSVVQNNNDQPVSKEEDDTHSSIFLSTTNVTSLCNNTGVGEDSTVKDKLVEEVRTKDNDSRLARYQRVRTFALWNKDKMKRKSTTTATTWCENSSGSKVLSSTKSSAEGKIALDPTFSSSYDDDDDDDYDKNPVIRSPSSDEELKDFDFLVHLA